MGLPTSDKRSSSGPTVYQETNHKQIKQLEAMEKARSCDTCHHAVSAAGTQSANTHVVEVAFAAARESRGGRNDESSRYATSNTIDTSHSGRYGQQPDTATAPASWHPATI